MTAYLMFQTAWWFFVLLATAYLIVEYFNEDD